jgi:tetrahydromethanopterin S-methyltransferase subunit F
MNISFSNKLVAVMNEKIESGIIMNALAHMCIGFGSEIGKDPLRLTNYIDANGGSHPSISEMPFMILKANSNKIRGLRQAALDEGIKFVDFTNTMTIGTYVEQIERTQQTKEEELVYYGIVLFGDWSKVSELTRKFSIWK